MFEIEDSAYVIPECWAVAGVGHEARHEDPFHEWPAAHAKVHCPGVSEKCQAHETVWEVAVDTALLGTDDWQTSATHEWPAAGTKPESQEAVSEEIDTLPKEHEAVAERVPFAIALETSEERHESSTGTVYPKMSAPSQEGSAQTGMPFTKAHDADGLEWSFTNPGTEPSDVAG